MSQRSSDISAASAGGPTADEIALCANIHQSISGLSGMDQRFSQIKALTAVAVHSGSLVDLAITACAAKKVPFERDVDDADFMVSGVLQSVDKLLARVLINQVCLVRELEELPSVTDRKEAEKKLSSIVEAAAQQLKHTAKAARLMAPLPVKMQKASISGRECYRAFDDLEHAKRLAKRRAPAADRERERSDEDKK